MTARSEDVRHGDRGLQPERTSLAWARTMLGLATVAVLCVRCLLVTTDRGWTALVPAATLAYACVTLIRVPAHGRRRCTSFADERALPEARRALALVVSVIALAAAAAAGFAV